MHFMAELSSHAEQMLRGQGLNDSDLARLASQGFLERSTGTATVRYEVLANGSVSMTSSSIQAIAGSSFDAAAISNALTSVPPGMAGMLADPIAQAETMLGQDLDGDGVIGSAGNLNRGSQLASTVNTPMQQSSNEYGMPGMKQRSSSGVPWLVVLLWVLVCAGIAWYLLSR